MNVSSIIECKKPITGDQIAFSIIFTIEKVSEVCTYILALRLIACYKIWKTEATCSLFKTKQNIKYKTLQNCANLKKLFTSKICAIMRRIRKDINKFKWIRHVMKN